MSSVNKHISVCICTFKRPSLLNFLLSKLEQQQTEELFSYSIVVVDNDNRKSAQDVVQSFQRRSSLDVSYYVESEQNIALARNKAVENAEGDFIAFIDDDEFPLQNWLACLFKAINKFKAYGILGPVHPYYEVKPPGWIIKGKFYERPSHKTGDILDWSNTRTGNVLLRREMFDGQNNMFNPEFGTGGEDREFFRRMISRRLRFVWCAEAPVFEAVPPERCKRSFMLRRALLRGRKTPYENSLIVHLKPFVAIPLYSLLLPFLLLTQHHIFMKYLIKDFDHIGRLLRLCGFNALNEKYITE
jgi:succinoglycan biosynthesis protein ExoM